MNFLGSFGLIVPELTHMLPWLTIVAAAGLVIIMIGAVIYHIVRKEYANIVLCAVLLILSAVIVYGRWILVPIHLEAWLTCAANSSIPEFKQFVEKLQKDKQAVTNGFQLPWSQGQVEGQVNRLKLLKRSMTASASQFSSGSPYN